MGLYIFSYGVDLQQVRQLFASKDEAAFQAIQATDTFDNYADQDSDDSVSTEEALRQIIYGEPYDAQSAESYGYALICICDYVGVNLSDDGIDFKLGYVTDLLDEYLGSDFDVPDFLATNTFFDGDLNLGLPVIEDTPIIGVMPDADLDMLHQGLQSFSTTDEEIAKWLKSSTRQEEDKGVAYETIKVLKKQVDYCKEHGVQLVSYCH